MAIIGILAIVFGLFFCSVGVIGVIRLPDTYSRLHASGKVATTGLFGLLVGAIFIVPFSVTTLKFIALGLFIVVTSPVTSHAIAAAVHRKAAREGRATDKFATTTVRRVDYPDHP